MALSRRTLSLHLLTLLLALVPRSLGDLQHQSSGQANVNCVLPTKHPEADKTEPSEVLQISTCIAIDLENPSLVPQKHSKSEKLIFVVSTSPRSSMICVGSVDLVTSSNQRFSFDTGITQESDGLVQLDVCRGPGISNCETVQIVLPGHRSNGLFPAVQATVATHNASSTHYLAQIDLCSDNMENVATRSEAEDNLEQLERDEMMTAGEEDKAAPAYQVHENLLEEGDGLEKRKWRDSGVSWMKRDPDSSSSSSSSDSSEDSIEGVDKVAANKRRWEKGSMMSWMKRKWAKDGMGWIKRSDADKRKWKNSNMQWVKK